MTFVVFNPFYQPIKPLVWYSLCESGLVINNYCDISISDVVSLDNYLYIYIWLNYFLPSSSWITIKGPTWKWVFSPGNFLVFHSLVTMSGDPWFYVFVLLITFCFHVNGLLNKFNLIQSSTSWTVPPSREPRGNNRSDLPAWTVPPPREPRGNNRLDLPA